MDVLKIDQVFIRPIDSHERERAIVRAMVDLARGLSLRTVAEGVENIGSIALLKTIGCGYAQGFGIQRPLPPDDLTAWLTGGGHGYRLASAQRNPTT